MDEEFGLKKHTKNAQILTNQDERNMYVLF